MFNFESLLYIFNGTAEFIDVFFIKVLSIFYPFSCLRLFV